MEKALKLGSTWKGGQETSLEEGVVKKQALRSLLDS